MSESTETQAAEPVRPDIDSGAEPPASSIEGEPSPAPLPLGSVASILAAKDISERVIPVPQWDCSVKVVGLSKRREMEMRKAATRKDHKGREFFDTERFEILMFTASVELSSGEKFTAEHVELLMDKSASAVDSILEVVMELNGMTERGRKAVEDLFHSK